MSAKETSLDDFQDELTGADSPSIGENYDERTHRAHTRYAATEEPGVVWFDRRDGREDYNIGKDVTLEDLDGTDDRELLRVQVRPHRPENHGEPAERYVVDRSLAYIHEYTPVGETDETERRVETCGATQVFDSLEDAREWCRENVEGYAEAPRRDAVLGRTEGEEDA